MIFKLLSTREKDVEDAAAIARQLGGALDVAMIDAEVELLAAELPEHDVEKRWRRCRVSG